VHGEKDLNGVNSQWSTIGMKAQIADVNKVLGSVFQMCKADNRVVFDINLKHPTQGGYIENKSTGKKTHMEVNQVTGEFQFDLWLKPQQPNVWSKPAVSTQNRFAALAAVSEETINSESDFQRQADPL
jgi:hypothetical protein